MDFAHFRCLLSVVVVICLSVFGAVSCQDGGADGNGDGDSGTDLDSDTDADSDGDGDCVPDTDVNDSFSFFAMSLEKIKEWSLAQYGDTEGLGGDLGGLSGADAKCQEAAEDVGSCKQWHAFLSATDDGSGSPVDAIDRIGSGPWYNLDGLLVADDIAGLLNDRPDGDSTTEVYNDGAQGWPFNQCLTTELGNCTLSYGDTHDTLTGSNRQGQLYNTDSKYTCNDWTSIDVNVQLEIGHSWPRQLDSTDPNVANWIFAHTNCNSGGPGGGGGSSATCNGCGRNINMAETFEDGVGGDGGYGTWYCFAVD
jgi:hypothetical protein